MSIIARTLPTVVRILLGLLFLGSGLAGLLQLAPTPRLDGAGGAFVAGLAGSGYFFPLLKITELVVAGLLLARLVPLALVIAAPIVVHVAAFHLFLAPDGLPVALFLVAAELYLAWTQREAFAPLFRRAAPPSRRRSIGVVDASTAAA